MSTTPLTRSKKMTIVWSTCVLAVAIALMSGYWYAAEKRFVPSPLPITAPLPPSLSFVISGDTAGWIVPCGCTSNQSGGLLRRGTYINSLRKAGNVVVADVGGAPAGTSLYEKLKFEAILKGELAMGLEAHNIGAAEARLGADYLRRVVSELKVPFVSANVRDSKGQRLAEPYKLLNVNGRQIALIGVLSTKYATNGLQISDPQSSVLSTIEEIRQSGGPRYVVVLAYLPTDELRSFAVKVPEADVVVGGPTGQAIAPMQVGARWLAAATNKGKFLATFTVQEQPYVSDSSDYRPRNLQEKIALPSPIWSCGIVEMTSKFADDPAQKTNLDNFYAVLEQQDVSADQTGFVPPVPADAPADFRIAGTASCQQCHAADSHTWETSTHSHAWNTLLTRGSHVDSYCQQCHTSGFGAPGGFLSAKRSADFFNVGCESCHGPSAAHAKHPEKHTPFVAREQCTRCHDHENSPQFEFASYWAKIEHGQSANPVKADEAKSPLKSESRP